MDPRTEFPFPVSKESGDERKDRVEFGRYMDLPVGIRIQIWELRYRDRSLLRHCLGLRSRGRGLLVLVPGAGIDALVCV